MATIYSKERIDGWNRRAKLIKEAAARRFSDSDIPIPGFEFTGGTIYGTYMRPGLAERIYDDLGRAELVQIHPQAVILEAAERLNISEGKLKERFEKASARGDPGMGRYLEDTAVGLAVAAITSEHLAGLPDEGKALVHLAILAEAAIKFYSH